MRNARSLALAVVVLPAVAFALHCGGPTPPKTPASASASGDGGAPPPLTISTALPSGARLPPPLQLSSQAVVPDGTPRCDPRAATGKDPKAQVESLAKLCSGARRDATGLAAQVVTLDPAAPATVLDFGLKECALVVAAAEPTVKSWVVVVQDAAGVAIVELPGDAVSPAVASPVVCGTGKVTLRVAVGSGQGKVAVGAELLRREAKP